MVPAIALFVGNVVCMCLALVQSATARQKARMKTMLTIDAAAEVGPWHRFGTRVHCSTLVVVQLEIQRMVSLASKTRCGVSPGVGVRILRATVVLCFR